MSERGINYLISSCPCQLFEVVDDKLGTNWHFRLINKEEDIYHNLETNCNRAQTNIISKMSYILPPSLPPTHQTNQDNCR